ALDLPVDLFLATRVELLVVLHGHCGDYSSTVDLFDRANRRRLTLKPGKQRVVANRHPWIFAGAIAKESGNADAAIANLVDGNDKLLASGFYSQHSQIRMRALMFDEKKL